MTGAQQGATISTNIEGVLLSKEGVAGGAERTELCEIRGLMFFKVKRHALMQRYIISGGEETLVRYITSSSLPRLSYYPKHWNTATTTSPCLPFFCATRTATKRKDAFMQASSHPGWRELVLKSENFGYFFMGIPSAIFLQSCT